MYIKQLLGAIKKSVITKLIVKFMLMVLSSYSHTFFKLDPSQSGSTRICSTFYYFVSYNL